MNKFSKWLKRMFKGNDHSSENITIINRNDASDRSSTRPISGRIIIKQINNHDQDGADSAAATPVSTPSTRRDPNSIPVERAALGKGIRVKHLTKPDKCPLCRTGGQVVANTDISKKWKCNACGHIF